MTDRREFLRLAGAASLAALVSVSASGAKGVRAEVTGGARARLLSRTELGERLADRADARRIGAIYRRRRPAEASSSELIARLTREANLFPGADERSVRRRLDARVQRDFATGRTVTLDGWVLSVTEARQCALHHLLTS